jgi:hypothetical protein
MNMDMYLLAIIGLLLLGILFVSTVEAPSAENPAPTAVNKGPSVTPNSQTQARVTIINSKAVATVTVEEE